MPKSRASRPLRSGWAPKRLLDIVLTLNILLLTWPFLLLIAAAVALGSPGPVFFVQKRVGLGGTTFGMIKFRSMYRDAEARRAALESLSDRDGICLKIRHDPRVTPVGRVLRRWSLDELPQLFNVLRGEMSLVGPRPALIEEVAVYPERAHLRHRVKPGITGLLAGVGTRGYRLRGDDRPRPRLCAPCVGADRSFGAAPNRLRGTERPRGLLKSGGRNAARHAHGARMRAGTPYQTRWRRSAGQPSGAWSSIFCYVAGAWTRP